MIPALILSSDSHVFEPPDPGPRHGVLRSREWVSEPGAPERPPLAGPVRRGGAPFTNRAG
jgi:hypothetical protein